MNFYFKEYDIKDLDWDDINKNVNNRFERTKNVPNIIQGRDRNDVEKKFGFCCEEIVFKIDDSVEQPAGDFVKYDYVKGYEYIDLKGLCTTSNLERIIDRKYSVCLLQEQVHRARDWCDEHGIDCDDYRYEIAWWDGVDGKFIRSTNDGLILSNILNVKPFRGKPENTHGTNDNPWQYKVELVARSDEDKNIIIDHDGPHEYVAPVRNFTY